MKPKTDKSELLPPIVFPGKTSKDRKYIEKLKEQKLIRPIGSKLYTSVPENKIASVVRSSWAIIVSQLYPKALISHRTALTYKPTENGEVFLTATTNRTVQLPGLAIRFMRGPGTIESDVTFMQMKASSFERAILENLSKAKGSLVERSVSIVEIESRLEDILRHKGEDGLNQVRERALVISKKLNMNLEMQRLDRMIGALLGTQSNDQLQSEIAISRSQGAAFDPKCFQRLEILFAHLRHLSMKEIKDKNKSSEHFNHKAFFESYFSNYIEGTIFEVKEAERIVFDKKIPIARPVDAHDILSTYKLISDPNEMRKIPHSFDELEEIIKSRHQHLFQERVEVLPGEFKKTINQAGSTVFVHPDYVRGTLQKGFDLYQSLPQGLARAIFMQFFISDVHPFNDGNGRLSRVMMNAELYSQRLATIIIPNVYRSDYVANLKALSRRSDPESYVRMLLIAHEFSALDFSDYVAIKKLIESNNWFRESDEAQLIRI